MDALAQELCTLSTRLENIQDVQHLNEIGALILRCKQDHNLTLAFTPFD